MVVVASVLTAFLATGKGILELNLLDFRALADAAFASGAMMAVMALTPLTRQYGVGSKEPPK